MVSTNVKDDCETCMHPRGFCRKGKGTGKRAGRQHIMRLSDIFKVMGDPTRLRIIHALSTGEMCVCDIACALGMEHSAISHQLRLLRNMRVVKFRKEGKAAFYSLDDEHVLRLFNEGLEHARHE